VVAIFENVVGIAGKQVPCGAGRGATSRYTGLPCVGGGLMGVQTRQSVWRNAVWWADEYLKKWKLKFAKSTFRKRIFEIFGTAHRSPNI